MIPVEERKKKCEGIILTESEKKLLKKIAKEPNYKLCAGERKAADALCRYQLIKFNKESEYNIDELYNVYQAYRDEKSLNQITTTVLLPIAVTLLTNGALFVLPKLSQLILLILL